MADIRMNRPRPDRSKINMSDDDDVRYWRKHLGVSADELLEAVDKVGNSAAAVQKELANIRSRSTAAGALAWRRPTSPKPAPAPTPRFPRRRRPLEA
jgi:Protein of unknown function (DUF3606)